MKGTAIHVPVLVDEVLEALNLKPGDVFLDGTLGGAGHAQAVVHKFGTSIRIIGLDRDPKAVERGSERLRTLTQNFSVHNESFRNLDQVLREVNVESPNAILFDLGFSSDQLADEGRGLSFERDEPLDMRLGTDGISAKDILNTFSEQALELIIRGFGEEKYSKQIAREIVQRREDRPFETTFDLVDAVETVKPKSWRDKIHVATKTFQALRIATNEELTALEEGLDKGFRTLAPQGRFLVISFHSLEDRIVKNFFRDKTKAGEATLITKKPLTASQKELIENPRSRSAKLRVLQKI